MKYKIISTQHTFLLIYYYLLIFFVMVYLVIIFIFLKFAYFLVPIFSFILQAEELVDAARETYPPTAKLKSEAQSVLDLLNRLYVQIDGLYIAFLNSIEYFTGTIDFEYINKI